MKIEYKKLGAALVGLFTANPELDASVQESLIAAAEEDSSTVLNAETKETKEVSTVTAEALQAQITEKDTTIAALQGKVDGIPDLEAKVAKLDELEAEAKQLREWKANYDAGVHGGEAGDRSNGEGKKKTSYEERAEAKASERKALEEKYPDMF